MIKKSNKEGVITTFTLTRNELEILELMWDENRPLTRTEVIDLSPERSWKSSSIHILLNKLIDKGAIVVDGFIRTGKNYGRTYSPSTSRDEYDKTRIKEQFKKGKLSIGELFTSLIEDAHLDEADLTELEDLLKAKRKKVK
ncbi:MAG: BlaI/MecI/CopY family transcriptional regulator [Clostridiales bacterium]|jgi:predicted transcriptional regulator|nr:BlaI/MecI/CopY family transcriptional regulator [Clostridiales bacterium]